MTAMDTVVHACPPDGIGTTPCCGKTPFELPRYDRITLHQDMVTCGKKAPYVMVDDPEDPPWGDDRRCPVCGTADLPLLESEPGETTDPDRPRVVLTYIKHCGEAWIRGPIQRRPATGR